MIGFFGLKTIVECAFLLCLLLMHPRQAIKALVIVSPLTTIASFRIGSDNTILLYQLMWCVAVVKILEERLASGKPAKLPFAAFLLFCLVSILLIFANLGIPVLNIDTDYTFAKFSYQQFTQFAYLLMAVSTSWLVMYSLDCEILSLQQCFRCLDIGLVVVLAIAALQVILPADFVTETFRNASNVSYTGQGNRISSTFLEPSMLSLYLVPMAGIHVVRLMVRVKAFSICAVLCSLIIFLQNRSSSAVMGLGVLLVVVLLLFAVNRKNLKVTPAFLVGLGLLSLFALAFVMGGQSIETLEQFASKISGEGVSGQIRSENASFVFGIFMQNPIFGIGWGTIRCESTLLNWLAEVGLVGTLFFAVPFAFLLGRLLLRRDITSMQLFMYLVIAASILVVSCPEPYYLTFWIIVGMSAHALDLSKKRNSPSFTFAKTASEGIK